jgi:hypothetical protein
MPTNSTKTEKFFLDTWGDRETGLGHYIEWFHEGPNGEILFSQGYVVHSSIEIDSTQLLKEVEEAILNGTVQQYKSNFINEPAENVFEKDIIDWTLRKGWDPLMK